MGDAGRLSEDLPEDAPVIERVKLIRAQLETLRQILGQTHGRALLREEKLAVAELAGLFAELTDAVRVLLLEGD